MIPLEGAESQVDIGDTFDLQNGVPPRSLIIYIFYLFIIIIYLFILP